MSRELERRLNNVSARLAPCIWCLRQALKDAEYVASGRLHDFLDRMYALMAAARSAENSQPLPDRDDTESQRRSERESARLDVVRLTTLIRAVEGARPARTRSAPCPDCAELQLAKDISKRVAEGIELDREMQELQRQWEAEHPDTSDGRRC